MAQKGLKVKSVEELLSKVRHIVTYFHKISVDAANLTRKQKSLLFHEHKLKVNVFTQWNSAYEMVECFLLQHATVITVWIWTASEEM